MELKTFDFENLEELTEQLKGNQVTEVELITTELRYNNVLLAYCNPMNHSRDYLMSCVMSALIDSGISFKKPTVISLLYEKDCCTVATPELGIFDCAYNTGISASRLMESIKKTYTDLKNRDVLNQEWKKQLSVLEEKIEFHK